MKNVNIILTVFKISLKIRVEGEGIMKNKNISDLDIIDNAIDDAKFVLNEKIPYKGIKKVFICWVCYLLASNLFLYVYWKLAIVFNFNMNEVFFLLNRIFKISLSIISVIVYIVATNRVNMALKEKNFLRTFTIFPILLALLKMLPSVFYYINTEIMMQLYDTFSFDLVITFIALFYIMKYFKDKRYKYLLIGLFIYMGITFFLMRYVVNIYVLQSMDMLILKIEDIIDTINKFSFYQIVIFGLSIYLMKDKNTKQ